MIAAITHGCGVCRRVRAGHWLRPSRSVGHWAVAAAGQCACPATKYIHFFLFLWHTLCTRRLTGPMLLTDPAHLNVSILLRFDFVQKRRKNKPSAKRPGKALQGGRYILPSSALPCSALSLVKVDFLVDFMIYSARFFRVIFLGALMAIVKPQWAKSPSQSSSIRALILKNENSFYEFLTTRLGLILCVVLFRRFLPFVFVVVVVFFFFAFLPSRVEPGSFMGKQMAAIIFGFGFWFCFLGHKN